jgi:hypothetical protein
MNLELKAEIVRRYGSQANFSTALKVDESFVSRVVRGRRTLEPKEQKKWAQALGKKPEDLFEE